jgi:hypothetical protein
MGKGGVAWLLEHIFTRVSNFSPAEVLSVTLVMTQCLVNEYCDPGIPAVSLFITYCPHFFGKLSVNGINRPAATADALLQRGKDGSLSGLAVAKVWPEVYQFLEAASSAKCS